MAEPERTRVSGCVICHDEADRIEDCLRSLSFCDEVVVVDSGSADATRDLAAALGARVVRNEPFPGFAAQRQFAVEQCRHDFVVCLDADERVTPALAEELAALAVAGALRGGYRVRRSNHYLGRRMRFGLFAPDYKLRIFDRRAGRVVSRRPPHDHVELAPGTELRELEGCLEHLNYRTLAAHVGAIRPYAVQFASDAASRGRRVTLLDAPVRAASVCFKSLVLKAGFLDGWRGVWCALLTTYGTWLKYWLAWRACRGRGEVA